MAAARKQAHAEAAARLASREAQWQAELARANKLATQAARAMAEDEAAAATARRKNETDQAVAAAAQQARTEADERRVSREQLGQADVAHRQETAVRAMPETERELANRPPPEIANGNDVLTARPDSYDALHAAGPGAESEPNETGSDLPVFFRQMVGPVQSPTTGWRRLLERSTNSVG